MAQRLELHAILQAILGSNHVYFQPPATVKMTYPCIVYKRDSVDTTFADNSPYRRSKRYSITIIDRDPDSDIPDKVASLPLCSFAAHFTTDNLNHDVFNLYF